MFMGSWKNCRIHSRKHYSCIFLGAIIGVSVGLLYISVLPTNPSKPRNIVYHSPRESRKPSKPNVGNIALSELQSHHRCIYPVVALITPELHNCQGALVLYGSIVRTVIAEKLVHKSICVNFMYINTSMSLTTMKRWERKQNPYANTTECSKLVNEKLNDLVPVNWYAVCKLNPPAWSVPAFSHWFIALNKIHLWAFHLFERVFILDVDIIVLRELTKIMDEIPMTYDITGGIDGWYGCDDRSRINGGAILIKGSAYLHSAALQMLQHKNASCVSQRWNESEQELLNCLCGFVGGHPQRPEFQCHLLPMYDHIFPKNYKCLDARTRPLRMIHFAGPEKPWNTLAYNTTDKDKLFWWCIKDVMSSSPLIKSTNNRESTINALIGCKPFSLELD
jgi:lipopolysaccharide biosynthesis glycosyltransferase